MKRLELWFDVLRLRNENEIQSGEIDEASIAIQIINSKLLESLSIQDRFAFNRRYR